MNEIHTLALNGNMKGIKQALKNKKAFLKLDKEKGWSPLHYAANYSKAKIVQIILNAGITPNIKSIPPEKQKQNNWIVELSPSSASSVFEKDPPNIPGVVYLTFLLQSKQVASM